MDQLPQLLNQEQFLRALFKAIPCGVLIVDRDRRIYAANEATRLIFRLEKDNIASRRLGEALRCVNANMSKKGCGYSRRCKQCQIRRTALDAIEGGRIERSRARVEIRINGETQEFVLLVNAAPFEHEGGNYAVVILEDVTELVQLRRKIVKTEKGFQGIIGRHESMIELFETIRDVAAVDVPVLLQGESGTGKELVAAAIHKESPRADKLFVPVNCAALPEGLLESELFGHVKGAFTGAIRDKKGRFELADGGTLFLDEIGELPKMVQVKLLRVLQEGAFEPVGSEKTIKVDVRIISATNKDLMAEVRKGNFREDLYYRINVVPIRLPPLRERKEDIPLLVDYFLDEAIREGIKTQGISKEAIELLTQYPWPGNVRELHSAVRFALVKSRVQVIGPEHLPLEILRFRANLEGKGRSRRLDEFRVREALVKTGGNKAKAARLLGVGRATLYRFLSEHPHLPSEINSILE